MKTVYEIKDIDVENNPIHKALFGVETSNLLVSLMTLPKKGDKTEEQFQAAMKNLIISNVIIVLEHLDNNNLMIVPKEQIPDVFRNA